MNFEPQKLFIGLIDFFAILLPGALLTYYLEDCCADYVLREPYQYMEGAAGWAAFLFSSYLLGHFLFLLGAVVFDEHVYDRIRDATPDRLIPRLAKGKALPWRFTRWLARQLMKSRSDHAVKQAALIKEHYLEPLGAASAINAFQWSKARLALEKPEALATVQRFEADSKFFRSLVVVLVILILLASFGQEWWFVAVGLPLVVLAFWRYVDQRVKSTDQAYWFIITLEGQREDGYRMRPGAPFAAPSHAGGVVWRRDGKTIEFLLVGATKHPHEWVLPKGHVETGESEEETAVREVREETGVWAKVAGRLGELSFDAGAPMTVQCYLMEALEAGKSTETRRSCTWLPLQKAVEEAAYPETRDLLRLAAERTARLPAA
jgi:ADP-ribose pyrophosphatase YjhB (NUDIX family)